MDFITIDFETATSERHSPCEIGLTFVKDSKIVDTKSWLIQPIDNEYDGFNIYIHGITPEDTADKPEFHEIWPEIRPLIENQFLIAHNAGFDFSVLRRTLELYQIPFPTLNYSCSYIFSKKVWLGLPAYDLKTLCKINDIDFKHHRAGPDSKATAELSLKAFALACIESLEDFPEKLRTNVGQLFESGYKPSRSKNIYIPREAALIVGDPEKHNPDSIFYGRTLVFTGALSSMVRSEAQKIIATIEQQLSSALARSHLLVTINSSKTRFQQIKKRLSLTRTASFCAPKGQLSYNYFLNNLLSAGCDGCKVHTFS